jgi:hypothetical protein
MAWRRRRQGATWRRRARRSTAAVAPRRTNRAAAAKHAERHATRADHGGGRKAEHHAARVDRGHRHADRIEHRGNVRAFADRHGDRHDVRLLRDTDRREVRVRDADRRFAASDFGVRSAASTTLARRDWRRRTMAAFRPGQAKKMVGALLPAALGASLLDGPYRQWYRDNDRYYYRDDGDYIYRVNRNGGLVDALFPFQDRAFSYYPVGMIYPADYNFYNVPYQYQPFYPDGNDYLYRYGDGAIYQVNRSTNAIDSIVALLAGDLAVGQPLPPDYGVYNVPLAYRDRYYDTPDALYRYNDGYIYRADPTTQLITAVIDALV